jgi:hypothetical protein
MATNECPCGIFRNDCEYHRPEPVMGDVVVDTRPQKPVEYNWAVGTHAVYTATFISCIPIPSKAT